MRIFLRKLNLAFNSIHTVQCHVIIAIIHKFCVGASKAELQQQLVNGADGQIVV